MNRTNYRPGACKMQPSAHPGRGRAVRLRTTPAEFGTCHPGRHAHLPNSVAAADLSGGVTAGAVEGELGAEDRWGKAPESAEAGGEGLRVPDVVGVDADHPEPLLDERVLAALLLDDHGGRSTRVCILRAAVVLAQDALLGPTEVDPEGSEPGLDRELRDGARQPGSQECQPGSRLSRRLRPAVGVLEDGPCSSDTAVPFHPADDAPATVDVRADVKRRIGKDERLAD